MRCLRQPCVSSPSYLDHRDLRVGILPQRQEIDVNALRLHGVARELKRSRQLQARQRVLGIDEHDAAIMENPLELGGTRNY